MAALAPARHSLSMTETDRPPAGPDPSSYGRVTNSDRYSVLHDAAHGLLDRLVTAYLVEREEGGFEIDSELARIPGQEVVRLRPVDRHGGPLTVAFSNFPGLAVRFGEWHVEYFPSCGCDACDEQPSDLAEDLDRKVTDLVEGRFSETISGWIRKGLSHRFAHSSGWTRLPRDQPLYKMSGSHHDWAPWPSR